MKLIHSCYVTVIAITVAALAFNTMAQSANALTNVETSIVIMNTNACILGDAVSFRLDVRNKGHEPITVVNPSSQAFLYSTVIFYVCQPNTTNFTKVEVPYLYLGNYKSMTPPTTIPTTLLQPNAETSFVFELSYDFAAKGSYHWLFPTPGEYKIKASIYFLAERTIPVGAVTIDRPRITIDTPPTKIKVNSPKDDIDIQAYADLMKLKYGFLFYLPDQFNPESMPGAVVEADEFIRRHPGCRYIALAQEFLHKAHSDKN